jgi:hypothetical protein
MRRRITLLMAALATLLPVGADTGSALAGGATRAAPYCGITWGSLPKSGGALDTMALLEVRTGRHDCYDRVVFEFNGAATGFNVGYRDVFTEGEGVPMNPYVAGGAVLGVQLPHPAYDFVLGWTFPARTGGHVAEVVGYDTLRDVVFGGSYEGYTTFAVGIRANLPFRVFTLAGPGGHGRIVLDVAHRWQT